MFLFMSLFLLLTAQGQETEEDVGILSLTIKEKIEVKGIFPTVNVEVRVVDGEDNPITDLDRDNFTIKDGAKYSGEDISVTMIEPKGGESAYVLLIDTSGSMEKQDKIESAKEACGFFIDKLSEDDQVALITFDKEVDQKGGFTNDKEELKKRLAYITEVGGGTRLFDAIHEATQKLIEIEVERKIMVVLTDGRDSLDPREPGKGSYIPGDVCLKDAIISGIPVYTIGLGNKADRDLLERFAMQTGGEYFYSPSGEELKTVFGEIFRRSRETGDYLLTYTIPDSYLQDVEVGDKRIVDVSVKYEGVPQKASRSYVVPPGKWEERIKGKKDCSYVWIVLAIAGAVLAVILFVVWARRKPKRKEISRMEPDSEPVSDYEIGLGEEITPEVPFEVREREETTDVAYEREVEPRYEEPIEDIANVVAYLRVMKAPKAQEDLIGTRYPVFADRATTIGRDSDRDISLQKDDMVSRIHAEVRYKQKRFIIEDQGSRNGTFIAPKKGAKFSREGRTEIKPGYLVGLGRSYVLKLELPEGKDARRTIVKE